MVDPKYMYDTQFDDDDDGEYYFHRLIQREAEHAIEVQRVRVRAIGEGFFVGLFIAWLIGAFNG